MSIAEFSVKNPVLVNLLMIGVGHFRLSERPLLFDSQDNIHSPYQ